MDLLPLLGVRDLAGFDESAVRGWICSSWEGWVDRVEHARGGTDGLPDMYLLVGRYSVPTELKIGRMENGKVKIDHVRPAQARWHSLYHRAGGLSVVIVGVRHSLDNGFTALGFEGQYAAAWWPSGLQEGRRLGSGPQVSKVFSNLFKKWIMDLRR